MKLRRLRAALAATTALVVASALALPPAAALVPAAPGGAVFIILPGATATSATVAMQMPNGVPIPIGTLNPTTGTIKFAGLGSLSTLSSLSGLDGSGVNVTPTGSTTPRTEAARAADTFNAKNGYGGVAGAVGDGVTSDRAALNAAIYAASLVCGEVYLPAGTYYVNVTPGYVQLRSCVTIRGAGKDKTVIQIDDTSLNGTPNTHYAGLYGSNISNFTMRDLTLKGMALSQPTTGQTAHNLAINGCSDVLVENVKTTYSRLMGMVLTGCQRVKALGVSVAYTQADGMSFQDSSDVTIADFDIIGANDDAISCHSNDAVAGAVRSNMTIGPGTITESQGISCLGPKQITVHDVVMRRVMVHGIYLQTGASSFAQGHTAGVAVNVYNNTITDVFARPENPPRNGSGYAGCIEISGDPSFAGSGSAAPGRAANNAIVDLFGSGAGNFYANNTASGNVASPGGYFWNVSGNQCLRTKPATTTWANWGASPQLWVGNNGSSPPWFTGAVTEAELNAECINVSGSLRYSLIANNICAGTGANAIKFSSTAVSGDYDGLVIQGNILSDFLSYGINFPASASDRVTIADNAFDGDPRFVSGARASGGTWASSGGPVGVNAPGKNGLSLKLNEFRNLQTPVASGGGYVTALLNTVYGTFNATSGYNAANTGIGTPPSQSIGWLWVPTDGNPGSSTFGQQTGLPNYAATNALPSPLIASNITNLGGVASVAVRSVGDYANGNTPVATIGAPTAIGGVQATAHPMMGMLGTPNVGAGGSGYAVGDILTIPSTGTCTHNPQVKVQSVLNGAVTAFSYWVKGACAATPVQGAALTGGSGSGATLGTGSWQVVSVPVDVSGSGYAGAPSVSISGPAGYQATATATLSTTQTFSAGCGSETNDATGTTLGTAGASGCPVKSAGALIDASGVRVGLTGNYTVPANTSLVRLTQASNVTSTVTLPTALADGQPIQFVNQGSGAVALAFSPAVQGWTQGATLAAGPGVGLRIRWDATAAAWFREQ